MTALPTTSPTPVTINTLKFGETIQTDQGPAYLVGVFKCNGDYLVALPGGKHAVCCKKHQKIYGIRMGEDCPECASETIA